MYTSSDELFYIYFVFWLVSYHDVIYHYAKPGLAGYHVADVRYNICLQYEETATWLKRLTQVLLAVC